MDCERAETKLKELALAGELASSDPGLGDAVLLEHTAVCPTCRAAFERAQAVVAAIDRGIAASVAENARPDFFARARARLAEPARAHDWRWAQVAAAGALAVAIVAVLLAWRHERVVVPGVPVTSAGNNSSVVESIAPAIRPAVRASASPAVPSAAISRAPSHGELGDLPPVLIAASEREAAARLVNDVSSGRVDIESLAGEAAPIDVKPVDLMPIDVATPDASLHDPPMFVNPESPAIVGDDAAGTPESTSSNGTTGEQR